MSEAVVASVLAALPEGPLTVFGYGSLMWRPGFPVESSAPARLAGYRRALCVWSWVHRGSKAQPGLVLGLDRGGSCVGRALTVAEEYRREVVAYLVAREMATPVYRPRIVRVRGQPGGTRPALTFTLDRQHRQYAGRLAPEAAAETVLRGRGQSGANPDYLRETVTHLRELGVHDAFLERVWALVSARLSRHTAPGAATPPAGGQPDERT
ncbi:MAG: gamma-glutamylcyclotransferase [Alphaproteobacteria bacterium]|nr:gamma-glutamylcyclotransferase [Alphaproteobacteria bacterium]